MDFWDVSWTTPVAPDSTDGDLAALVPELAAAEACALWLVGHQRISDAGLAALAAAPWLTHLDLSRTSVSDAGLAHLSRMRLEYLGLNHTRATGAGLAHLHPQSPLRILGLRHANVDAGGLRAIGRRASITKLGLTAAPAFDDDAAPLLDALGGLSILDANETPLGDAGLTHLAARHPLQKLFLSNTRVTDAGVVQLRRLRSLTTLHLAHTRVSDAGVQALDGMASLEVLDVSGTEVSGRGLLALAALPKLQRVFVAGCAIAVADREFFHDRSRAQLDDSDDAA